jgi:hypothetical protein
MSSKFSNFSFSELFQTDSFNPEASIGDNKQNKSLMNITNNTSNISRYEEQKSMQKSREMDIVFRLYLFLCNFRQANLEGLQNVDKKIKDWMAFKPIKNNKK